MAKNALKGLPWSITNYNLSLESSIDNAFFQKLLKTDPEAAKFYLEFWIESNTNNPTTDWGRKRRNARRHDAYNFLAEPLTFEE